MFKKKLIPHVFMSKDDFPPIITPNIVLDKTYDFIEDWKNKLYDMISFNTVNQVVVQVLLIIHLDLNVYNC